MNRINNTKHINQTMDSNRTATRKTRTKLKAINNFLMCCLCKGYIIEATAISDCLHSFCRSCIVKHLTEQTYCPKCGIQNVSKASLRPDDIIKSLVYKVVPALYQSECQKTKKFNKLHNVRCNNGEDDSTTTTLDENKSRKQHYFSPDEPISLSLTYHAESWEVGNGVSVTTPPINYLQCPAAVTIHHLKRFVSAKYGIDIERDVNIEIICEDEVLPEDFTLMDVAYCYKWTRACPMQLMYRIFLHTNNNNDHQGNPKDIPLSVEQNKYQNIDNKNNNQTDKTELSPNNENRYTNNMNEKRSSHNNGRSYTTIDTNINKNTEADNQFLVPSTDFKRLRSYASVNSSNCGSNQAVQKDIEKTQPSNTEKCGTSASESKKELKPVESNTVKKFVSEPNDKVGDHDKKSGTDTGSKDTNKILINSNQKALTQKTEKEELKFRHEATNNKKCYTNTKKGNTPPSMKNVTKESEENNKQEIPRLRIELPTLKRDKEDSNQSKDGSKPKIILKLPSPPVQPNQNVDVTEYAKNIGLLPVSELQERNKKRDKEREELSHKKRKKAKHSKEPNGKKRKIHAEVSSLTLNDEVKLKVKISKPPHKLEKRSNSIDQNKTSSNEPPKHPERSTNESVKDKTKDKEQPATSSILRAVRHKPMVFIPNVDKNMSETEQDSISDIVKKVQSPENKTPVDETLTNKAQFSPKTKSPVQRLNLPSDSMQKSSSPILNQQQIQQQQKQQQLQRQPIISKPMSPIEAFQAFQKAQMTGMMLMPPYSQASGFDVRMQRMSSPSHTGRAFSPRPRNTTTSPIFTTQSGSTVQQGAKPFYSLPSTPSLPSQNKNQPMKRSAGSDTPLPMPKTPRVNYMDLVEQKKLNQQKRVYAPLIDHTMKAPESRSINNQAPKQQQSTKSSEHKKPLPRLIAPSSISVTRVGDTSNVPVPQQTRPAVEILKIPSTVPAIDQKSNANNNNSNKKPQLKPNRPPPGTIPLFQIQKLFKTGKPIPSQVDINKKSGNEASDKALDLSLSPTGGVSNKNNINKNETGPVIDLTDSNESGSNNRRTSEEQLQTMLNNIKATTITSKGKSTNNDNTNSTLNNKSDRKPTMPGLTALVHPKNQEILKKQGLVRQQNMSVRNVPNPSVLAFRNQSLPSLTKIPASPPSSKLNEKVHQLHNLKESQQRQRIAPED